MRKIDLAKQAAWSRANEKSRIEKGARYLPGGLMTPAAAAALDALMAAGAASSKTAAINAALVEAAARRGLNKPKHFETK